MPSESQFASDVRADALQKHAPNQHLRSVPPTVSDTIRAAVPSGKHAEILALFEHRITWACVKHWKAGRKPMPAWAATILHDHLRALADSVAARRAVVEPSHVHGARILRIHNHARAKEKVGS